MTFEEANKKIDKIIKDWYLRMDSISFIMIVHKETNEYTNIYDYQFPKGMIRIFANKMEKHPAIR